MNREQLLDLIFSQFDNSAQEFCKKTNGNYCEISSQYKGKEKAENLTKRFAKISYNSFAIKFVYIAHGFLGTVNSVLSCLVSLDKTEETVEIPLPLFSDYCDKNIKSPLSLSLISNEIAMKQAFSCLENELGELLDLIADISYSDDKKEDILNAYNSELQYIWDIKNSDDFSFFNLEYFSDFLILRFASDYFINYLKGDYKKAVKQINKIKKVTGYEKRLVKLLDNAEISENSTLSELVANAELYNPAGMPKMNGKEFLGLFLSWIILTPVISAVFIGLYFLIVFIEGINSVYLMGPIYNFPMVIMFGFILSIISSYFFRFKIYKLINKRHYKRNRELDYIQNGKKEDKLMKGMLTIFIYISIIGTFLLAKWNLNFLNDGFIDNSKFFSIKGEYHSYDEIKEVFYRPDRINGLGEKIDYDSYVVLLEDGTEIDLYEHGETEDYEDELLEFLIGKGIAVKK